MPLINKRRVKDAFVCDAISPTGDPTGTGGVRRRYGAVAEMKFRRARMLLQSAIVGQDILGLKPQTLSPLALAGGMSGNMQLGFQTWLDSMLKKVVVEDNGSWMQPMIVRAYMLAVGRGMRLTEKAIGPENTDQANSIASLTALCLIELQGACEAVSQRVMRAVNIALIHKQTPKAAFVEMDKALRMGIVRSQAMIELMVVKAHSTGTLDQFEAAGVTRVGLIPETVSRLRTDENPNHDPATGQFSEGGGALSVTAGPSSVVNNDPRADPRAHEIQLRGKEGEVHYRGEVTHERTVAPGDLWAVGYVENVSQEQHGQAERLYREMARYVESQGGRLISGMNTNRLSKAVIHKLHTKGYATKIKVGENQREVYRIHPEKQVGHKDAKRGAKGTGPGSKTTKGVVPSRRTVQRIRKAQREVESLGMVNVETAGDEDVCPVCEDIEANGPYTINEARGLIPAHPHCRCGFVPLGGGDEIDPEDLGDAEWNEEDHPRDPDGRFEGGGTAPGRDTKNPFFEKGLEKQGEKLSKELSRVDFARSPVEEILIDKLVSGQRDFDRGRADKMREGWDQTAADEIWVVPLSGDHQGKYQIIEGNHRAVAARELGHKTMKARVYKGGT